MRLPVNESAVSHATTGTAEPTIDFGPRHQKVGEDDLISVPEAARRVGVHTDTLYRLCRTGQFPPALQIGARWRVSVPRLERHLHGEADMTWASESPPRWQRTDSRPNSE
jgi:excisionase family DNA binding protein